MCVKSVEKGEQNSGPKLPQAWEPAQEDFYRNCSRPRVFLWVFAREAEGLLHAPAEWCLRLTDFVFPVLPFTASVKAALALVSVPQEWCSSVWCVLEKKYFMG